MIKNEDLYQIGKLGKPHGVKGETTMMFTDDIFDRVDADYLFIDIDGIPVPFFIEEYRFHGSQTALMKFCDIDTQEQARELTGRNVLFPRELSDSTAENISWAEIIDYKLIDESDKKVVGTIKSVDNSTINILFEVITADQQDLLIPASEDLISEVDTEQRTITVSLPKGILDLE